MDDLEEIEKINRTLIEVWGSEERAYSELQALVAGYNRDLFDGKLPDVVVGIATRWLLAGPLGAGTDAAANYNPASSGLPPTIYLGNWAIASKERAALILAHEVIHHWEQTIATDSEETGYPAAINDIIKQCYSDAATERRWRAAHSDRFMAKAYAASLAKGWDIAKLLTGKKYYDWLEP